MTRPRGLVVLGVVLAALSLGLPWGVDVGVPGFTTLTTYVPTCDADGYCTSATYFYVPGTSGGVITGSQSTARFFVAGCVALALIGTRLRRRAYVRAAVAVAAVGILYDACGLTAGAAALALAAGCFWLAARSGVPRGAEVGHGARPHG